MHITGFPLFLCVCLCVCVLCVCVCMCHCVCAYIIMCYYAPLFKSTFCIFSWSSFLSKAYMFEAEGIENIFHQFSVFRINSSIFSLCGSVADTFLSLNGSHVPRLVPNVPGRQTAVTFMAEKRQSRSWPPNVPSCQSRSDGMVTQRSTLAAIVHACQTFSHTKAEFY
jgi:hypothetical protein